VLDCRFAKRIQPAHLLFVYSKSFKWEKLDAIQVGFSGFAVDETAAVTVLTAAPAFQATIPPSFFTPFERLFFIDWTPP
jgi:hypothetical protein